MWLIVQAVAWYQWYPLLYQGLVETFLKRGFEVDRATINRSVIDNEALGNGGPVSGLESDLDGTLRIDQRNFR